MRAAHGAAPLCGRGATHRRWLAAMAAGAVLVLAACSDSSSGPEETPTLALSLSASTAPVVQGQSATVTATITRGGGFDAAVALTAEGAPAGLTAAFSPASLTGATTSSTLTLTAAAGLAAGTYNLTVRAAGTGVTAQTAALAVTVSAAPAITAAINPTALTVTQGAQNTTAFTLTRVGGYAGAVDLTVEGAPAGVTATFAPAQLGAGVTASTLTVAVANTVVAGNYPLTLRAHGAGVTDQTVTLNLTVVAATSQGFTLALAPAQLSVQQGASGTVKLTATRAGGFAGPITVSAGGGPAGITTTLPSTTLAGDTMTLTFGVAGLGSAGGTPLPGVYVLNVTGQATGLATQSVQLPLTVTAAPGGFDVSVSPAAVTLAAGATGRAAVRIAKSGGYTGSVTLSVAGAPPGLTATLGETTTAADSVELSLAATAATAPGPYPLKVIGQVAGLPNDTTTLNVTVTAAPAGSFTIALNPTALNVTQGANATSALAITRTGGFAGAVNLTATGAPNGVTVTFDSTAVGGTGTTVRVAAAGNAPVGTHNITVHANATGIAEQTANLAVTVAQSGGGGGNVTFSFCAGDAPRFFAVQDGTGAWTRVTGTAGGLQYSFDVGTRGGVAYVDSAGDLTVAYASGDELRGVGAGQCVSSAPATGKTLNGSVAGLGLTDFATVMLGSASASANSLQPTFQLQNVPDGALDLVSALLSFDLQTFALSASKLILRRGINLPNNATIPVLDFNSAEAFAPVRPNLTINGLGTDSAYLGLGYTTAAGTSGFFNLGTTAFYFFGTQGATGTYPGIPAAKQAANDLHMMTLFARGGSEDTLPTRAQISFFKTAADMQVTLGPQMGAVTITKLASAPYLRLQVQLAKQPEYDDILSANFSQGQRNADITATAGYLGSGTTWDVSIPDLSAIGFDPAWGLSAAAETFWSVSAINYTGPGSLSNFTLADGVILRYAARSGNRIF